jgi:primary-amine oxidase
MGTGLRRVKASAILVACAAAILAAASAGSMQAPDPAAASSPRHPLDPLSAAEVRAAIAALAKAGRVDEFALYPLVTLEEPPKAVVLAWTPGQAIPRRAFIIAKQGRSTFEAVVDVSHGEVVSWRRVDGVQPGILPSEEWTAAGRIVFANQDWQAAVRKRGIESYEDIVCVPFAAGEEAGGLDERLANVICFDSSNTRNFWSRPIEGVIAVVDLNDHRVVRLVDTGVVPIPRTPADFTTATAGPVREPRSGIAIEQRLGPGFRLEGQTVTWGAWQFHVRLDPRLGLVVSMVRFLDRGTARSVLYQGSMSELFVPYMDPGSGWSFRAYLDAGEDGLGKLAAPLEPGRDCPSNAVFLDAVFADDWGEPYTRERAACLFERSAGDVTWRHFEAENQQSDVAPRTDLVLRSVSAVANYDYVFDWAFHQDGTIAVAVGATGIAQVKAVSSRTARESTAAGPAYGRMVAPHTSAINHDHFFCFRLDLDVDGPQNSFRIDRLKTTRLDPGSPRQSVWIVEGHTAAREQDARLPVEMDRPALWRVINPGVVGPLGYPVSYELRPGMNAVSLLAPGDSLRRRAGFANFHLWVTPYRADERYAAGTYPFRRAHDDGLPAWTSANRSLERTDLVLWYTMGFHHVARAEDWPVVPVMRQEFELRPFDFFERNPTAGPPR